MGEPDGDVVERGDGGVAGAVVLADALDPGSGRMSSSAGVGMVLVMTDMWFS